MEAKVVRLGGTPLERAIRAAENDLKTARFARDRVRGQYKAIKEELERREQGVANAEARVAALKGKIN